jgi:hypothetical protein
MTIKILPVYGEVAGQRPDGGGLPQTLCWRMAPSTALRAVPLPVPGRI